MSEYGIEETAAPTDENEPAAESPSDPSAEDREATVGESGNEDWDD